MRDQLEDLRQAREEQDQSRCAFLLRSTLQRDLGGMGNPRLYEKCRTGTKKLIEEYIDEVVYQLKSLSASDIPGFTQRLSIVRSV